MVQPSPRESRQEEQHEVLHLTPWDLKVISMDYIQKGILLLKPPTHEATESFIIQLRISLSIVLNHFFPLAGRLKFVRYNEAATPFVTVSLTCNDEGAEFIHAVATAKLTISDIVDSLLVPPIVQLFFPLNGVKNHEGEPQPLLAIQVTELEDGIFIGCSLNHVVGDGFSFWHFINSWSEISRIGSLKMVNPPLLDRCFLRSCTPPIHLPLEHFEDTIKIYNITTLPTCPALEEGFFHFSAQTIAELKSKANAEMNTEKISSFQALLAHVWRSSRALEQYQMVRYFLAVGCRSRLKHPLPETYLGNAVLLVAPGVTVKELVEGSLGWAAMIINQAVVSMTPIKIEDSLESWAKNPLFLNCNKVVTPCDLLTGSSHRFDVYGNDFGCAKPNAVRSGMANKFDGKVTIFPGSERGSMALEICLSPYVLRRLIEDQDFLETVVHF
ncbi:putative shikimate O-hydroxycinnamoyltransferase [Dioscorea sansibarensis]